MAYRRRGVSTRRIGLTHASHGDVLTEVTVPALQTARTTITFEEAGTLAYICHLPAHEAYGMVGALMVEVDRDSGIRRTRIRPGLTVRRRRGSRARGLVGDGLSAGLRERRASTSYRSTFGTNIEVTTEVAWVALPPATRFSSPARCCRASDRWAVA